MLVRSWFSVMMFHALFFLSFRLISREEAQKCMERSVEQITNAYFPVVKIFLSFVCVLKRRQFLDLWLLLKNYLVDWVHYSQQNHIDFRLWCGFSHLFLSRIMFENIFLLLWKSRQKQFKMRRHFVCHQEHDYSVLFLEDFLTFFDFLRPSCRNRCIKVTSKPYTDDLLVLLFSD